LRSPGQPLDAIARAYFEPRFGQDFGGVRVHTDAKAAASAHAVNALAYTVGRDVVFSSGQYVPASSHGRRLLAHELTHVVQQSNQVSRSSLAIGPIQGPLEQEVRNMADGLRGDKAVHPPGPDSTLSPLLQREVTTDNCEALESDVKSTHQKAMDMTQKALDLLNSYDGTNPTSVRDALSQHFHTTDLRDAQNIISMIQKAERGADDATYECHEDEEKDGYVGWSMWCVPFTDILLYKPWFDPSRTQTKKAKTMIHEWMHRYSCLFDLGYEGSDAYKNSSTFRAMDNASPYAAVIEALGS
jgi:hypothetical protein